MKTRTIEAEWESYRQAVIPADASEVQITECRRAFYSGAWAAFVIMRDLGKEDVSEDEGVKQLELLEAECKEFCSRVKAGVA